MVLLLKKPKEPSAAKRLLKAIWRKGFFVIYNAKSISFPDEI